MNNIEKFLKEIGVQADAIEQLKSEEEIKVSDLSSEYKASMKNVWVNDPEVINPIKNEIKGKELSQIEHKIKKVFGLSGDEIKDLKFDEIMNVAIDKVRGEKTDINETLQNDLIKLRNQVKDYEDNVIPTIKNEGVNKLTSFKKELQIRNILGKQNLIVKNDLVFPSVQKFLADNYDINIDDTNELNVKTKEGLNPLDKDGTKVMSLNDIIVGYLNDQQVIKQSNGDIEKESSNSVFKTLNLKTSDSNNDEPRYKLAGMDKAIANAKRLKEMKPHKGLSSL